MADYRLLLGMLVAGFLSQLVKGIHQSIVHKRLHHKAFLLAGHMPSTHAALSAALLYGLFTEQASMHIIAVAVLLTVIIIVDAMGVRRSAGEEGNAFNKLIEKENWRISRVHVTAGHTPLQVVAGLLLGVIGAYVAYAII